jgi:hypothetical protein
MNVPTEPNPIYTSLRGARRGFVDKKSFNKAVAKAKTLHPNLGGRSLFDRIREYYWIERIYAAQAGEFNAYNRARMISGKPPIGPDGAPMELEHRVQFHSDPNRVFDPDNIWELFRREHDFQHGEYGFRWSLKKLPQSPHDAGLATIYGNPQDYKFWP